MVPMWLLWLRHRWRLASAIAALLTGVLFLLLALGNSGASLQFLGNAGAPRPAVASEPSGVILPRSGDPRGPSDDSFASIPQASLLDTNLPASAGPQTVAEAQAAWSAEEIARHQREVLVAVNCARRQQTQRALQLDPTLSQQAGDAWLKLIHDPSWSLMQLPGRYALRGMVSLDFSFPGLASREQPQLAGERACAVGGLDAATLESATSATAIGIAVFPPQASWDSASAVVLVR